MDDNKIGAKHLAIIWPGPEGAKTTSRELSRDELAGITELLETGLWGRDLAEVCARLIDQALLRELGMPAPKPFIVPRLR